MYLNRFASLFVRYLSLSWFTKNLAFVGICACRVPAVTAAIVIAAGCVVSALPADAQTTIYDGSQELNFISFSRVGDTDALPLVQLAGADPNVLEDGDSAWFRSGGRKMRNTNAGLAGTATGVDGNFMSHVPDPQDLNILDARAAGAAYVLKDAKATTGRQLLNLSVYFNDPTPNDVDNETSRNSGGMAAIRVYGVQNNPLTDPLVDPWESAFELVAAAGSSGANIAAGEHARTGSGAPPVNDPTLVDSLLFYQSRSGLQLLPSTEWQQLSLEFDAGTGYDWLVFGFGGGEMDGTNLPADRFGFDNISFEAGPTAINGDYDDSGQVGQGDLDLVLLNWGDDASVVGVPEGWVNMQPTGVIGQAVLDGVLLNWGNAALAGAVSAIPEPSSLMLLALASGLVMARRR